jgi:hypothetical protein|nr:MAG TPA: hypothetical protein [Caudoviricetes sp.]
MEEFKPNSHKSKELTPVPEKKVEKIVKGTVKSKKKNGIDRLKDNFISEDAANIKTYVVMDVLIPAVKKAICDIVKNGVDMILYGESGRSNRRPSEYVSYDRRYLDRGDSRFYNADRARIGYSYNDIILETRGEAEDVLARMDELIEIYGMVSVADLYDLVGITGNYTDNKYGWTNIRNAEPVHVRDGYMLRLPKVTSL